MVRVADRIVEREPPPGPSRVVRTVERVAWALAALTGILALVRSPWALALLGLTALVRGVVPVRRGLEDVRRGCALVTAAAARA